MESYNGNRVPERGHYSYNNSRNQNRLNYRRMNNQSMSAQMARQMERSNSGCPCASASQMAEAAERNRDRSCDTSEKKCDNGASESERSCNISYLNDSMHGMPLAMAYVPWQRFNDTYEICRALQIGTIFPELNAPFLIGRCAQWR